MILRAPNPHRSRDGDHPQALACPLAHSALTCRDGRGGHNRRRRTRKVLTGYAGPTPGTQGSGQDARGRAGLVKDPEADPLLKPSTPLGSESKVPGHTQAAHQTPMQCQSRQHSSATQRPTTALFRHQIYSSLNADYELDRKLVDNRYSCAHLAHLRGPNTPISRPARSPGVHAFGSTALVP